MTAVPRPRWRPEDLGSVGTAGRDYRVPDQPHPYDEAASDYGERARCGTCGRQQTGHEEGAR